MVGIYKVVGPRIGLVGGKALTFKKPKDLLVGCADTKSSVLIFSGFCTEKHSRGHWRLPKQDRYVCMSS